MLLIPVAMIQPVRRLKIGLAIGAVLVAMLAVPTTAVGAVPYVYYVACSTSKSAPPATTCSKSSNKAAFFKSNLATVHYKVCVKFPSGIKLCANNQEAPKGVKKVNPISSTMKGLHKVKWYVGGDEVGSYTFTVN